MHPGQFESSSLGYVKRFASLVFVELDGSAVESGVFGNILAVVISSSIVLAFLSSVAETVPLLRHHPKTCLNPVCNNNENICPGRMVCESVISRELELVDEACVAIFLCEYVIRFVTVWAVDSRTAKIVPTAWLDNHLPTDDPPVYSLLEHYARFVSSFRNLVDLVSIAPYLIGLSHKNDVNTNFIRVVRLARVFGLVSKNRHVKLFYYYVVQTMRESYVALFVLMMFSTIGALFHASIIFACERGEFRVTSEYPDGAYLRRSSDGSGWEASPFDSLPDAIYFVVETMTSVGFGDSDVTSIPGRFWSNVIMYMAVLTFAFPIGVVAAKFQQVLEATRKDCIQGAMDPFAASRVAMTQDSKEPLMSLQKSHSKCSLDSAKLRVDSDKWSNSSPQSAKGSFSPRLKSVGSFFRQAPIAPTLDDVQPYTAVCSKNHTIDWSSCHKSKLQLSAEKRVLLEAKLENLKILRKKYLKELTRMEELLELASS